MKYSGVDGGAKGASKRWGYVSGLCEDCADGGAYWVREDGASEKKWQELLVLLAVGYEGAK